MEKEIGKLIKNETADILLRIDDFGGKIGLTIREFVTSEKYTGFTKAGVRIPAVDFLKFREMINSIDLNDMNAEATSTKKAPEKKKPQKAVDEEMPDY
jgi:hypothetical protein